MIRIIWTDPVSSCVALRKKILGQPLSIQRCVPLPRNVRIEHQEVACLARSLTLANWTALARDPRGNAIGIDVSVGAHPKHSRIALGSKVGRFCATIPRCKEFSRQFRIFLAERLPLPWDSLSARLAYLQEILRKRAPTPTAFRFGQVVHLCFWKQRGVAPFLFCSIACLGRSL